MSIGPLAGIAGFVLIAIAVDDVFFEPRRWPAPKSLRLRRLRQDDNLRQRRKGSRRTVIGLYLLGVLFDRRPMDPFAIHFHVNGIVQVIGNITIVVLALMIATRLATLAHNRDREPADSEQAPAS